ncbi:hypothetical protein [Novosphingobium sp. CECT 9465]|jgi:hypothetical protein|uniref:hypothetical protein n=1 Tax=Novosphingobium sp. CECT 9465 TaxID=2829794 RepID=UPI001E2B84FB|nr:hypothetical protein [Novosphingobium sp. CECT 9465]CAH0498231.1 hypothetical protein NVSP9465_03311 [Novosphingobium sp. CECT 9465]
MNDCRRDLSPSGDAWRNAAQLDRDVPDGLGGLARRGSVRNGGRLSSSSRRHRRRRDHPAVKSAPELNERIAAGEFDLAGAGHSLISDPAWAEKVRANGAFLPFHPRVLATIV